MQRTNNIKSLLLILVFLIVGVGESVAGVSYNQIKDGGVYTIANHIINGGGFHNYIWYNTSNSKAAYGPTPDEGNYQWIAHKVNSNTYCFENYTNRGKYLNMENGGLSVSPYNYTLSNGHNGATGYITMQNGSTRYGGWYGAYDGTSGNGDRYGFGRYGYGGCISTQGTAQATNSPYWSTDWELVFTGTYVQPDAPFSLSPSDDEWAENTRWYYINIPLTGGYLGYGTGYSDANGLLVNNLARPTGNAGLWALVKRGDRVQLYNKAAGTSLVLSAPSGGDPEKLAMLNKNLTVSNNTTANPSIVKENAWSLLSTNKDINGTQEGYFLYRHNNNVWHRCVVFENNYLVAAYSNGWSANTSTMQDNMQSKIILVPADTPVTMWTVNINGGTADDRVIFCGVEYTSGSQIGTETITAENIRTNITDRVVFSPVIDAENHTVTFHVRSEQDITGISDLSLITDPYGYYKLTSDITSPAAIIDIDFQGYLDGDYHKITGLTHAIFNNIDGAKISNLILEDVAISGTTVGAIANTATGNSRVYNCGVLSGSVNGSTEAGSIVGRIEGNARVVNCYSYANVSGGTVAGIVGNNAGTSATKETVFNGTGTLVMNCAHFGRLSGSSGYPVFGGNDINNVSGVNTYNYYIYDAGVTYASPNSAQGTEETAYFNRFDFYRGILNSHRELAAMYIHGTQNVSQEQIENIAHWKYDRNVADYLSQEPWPKNTTSTLSREIPSTDKAYKGKRVGTVSATFIINGHSETVALSLTDMNTDRWDYTYGKVVLPFANEFSGWTMPASGNTDYDNIITGWEVTNITGGTAGTYSNYNLCDPDCTAKDLYENNNYVWAQGGNFVVPKDVTAITFTAHIVRAVYLRDARPDYSYDNNYSSRTDLGSAITGTYNGKTVYNSMAEAFANLENKTNPADQAIVLVGNYHFNKEGVFPNAYGNTSPVAAKAVTIMSIDADNNQDPDYCFYQFNTGQSGRVVTPPLRFDFVTSPDFAMASYTKGGLLAGIGIIHAGGWFETTETATLKMTEFEMRPQNYRQASPVILNGGIFDKIVMTSTNEYGAETGNLLYTKIGGKVYVSSLNLGRANGVNTSIALALHPLNVSGGEIVNCHLTGAIHNGTTSGNACFFCSGGYIHEFNGAYQERINGNMIAKMDHALIDEFYGGGADDAYGETPQITGDINITCNNSYVKFFCGGPKFGNMASGKTVTVTAEGSTFDEYYGASYGGTALTTNEKAHRSTSFGGNVNITFALEWNNYTNDRLKFNDTYKGIGVDFDLDFFQYAGGGQATGNQSFYVKYASLSLAKTGSVTSTMTNCTFNGHFFGGGCRGLVDGNVTSTLTDCIVKGNAYGGGYTPTATECMVYPETQPTYPVYKGLYGLFTKYVRTSKPEAYRWVQADDGHDSGSVDKTNKLLYTSVDMTQMGVVTGNTSLTIKGSATVIEGDVFGGGAESVVKGNTTVVIGEQP